MDETIKEKDTELLVNKTEDLEEIRLSSESERNKRELQIQETRIRIDGEEKEKEEKEEEEKEIILSYKFTNEELNVSPQQFLNVIQQVNQAIKNKQLPRRIHQGSSGSYFCVDKDGNNLGVFKPKDEEPYGQLNPKWTKWLHRNLFPCCFGRSSLIPNLGYLSESSASIVDRSLNLGLVPRTEVVKLSSPSFHYRYKDKRTTKLPLKIGSFQLFLNNYMNGTEFLEKYPFPKNNNDSDHFLSTDGILKNDIHSMNHFWTFKRKLYFRLELEKLIVLDYLIRNTDRSSDNWMIKVLGNEEIRIAAIDHGLAFPHKHPDKWRSYPYGWLSLPIEIIGKPFHKITRAYLLPILTSIEFWDQLEHQLLKLNKIDNDFNLKMFQKQMQVIKGQGFNLLQSLLNSNDGPIQLCNRKNKVVEEIVDNNNQNDEFNLSVINTDNNNISSNNQSDYYSINNNMNQVSNNNDVTLMTETPNKEILLNNKDPKLINFNDPFEDKFVLNNNPLSKKKILGKLKEITTKPWFTSC